MTPLDTGGQAVNTPVQRKTADRIIALAWKQCPNRGVGSSSVPASRPDQIPGENSLGWESIPPDVYFRMLLVGYFEGLDSRRAVAGRGSDSRSLRAAASPGSGRRGPTEKCSRWRHPTAAPPR
jgi:hypothetical protein